jgi:hypothetical protein
VVRVEFDGGHSADRLLERNPKLDGHMMLWVETVNPDYARKAGDPTASYTRSETGDSWELDMGVHGKPATKEAPRAPGTPPADPIPYRQRFRLSVNGVRYDLTEIEKVVKDLEKSNALIQLVNETPTEMGKDTPRVEADDFFDISWHGFEYDMIVPHGVQVTEAQDRGYGSVATGGRYRVIRAVYDGGRDPRCNNVKDGGHQVLFMDDLSTPAGVEGHRLDVPMGHTTDSKVGVKLAERFIGQEVSVNETPRVAAHNGRHFIPAQKIRTHVRRTFHPKSRRVPGRS